MRRNAEEKVHPAICFLLIALGLFVGFVGKTILIWWSRR